MFSLSPPRRGPLSHTLAVGCLLAIPLFDIYSPMATGTSLWKDGHMDGAFSVWWDPVLKKTKTTKNSRPIQELLSSVDNKNKNNNGDNENDSDIIHDCCTLSLSLPLSLSFFGQALNFLMSPSTARLWFQEGWNTGVIQATK
jgi:hypothetical protein